MAGEIWYSSSILGATVLFGLAVFLFIFGVLPYYWKVHKHLNEILGCWALTFPNGMFCYHIGFLVGTYSTPQLVGSQP